jgi:hypothetical protein
MILLPIARTNPPITNAGPIEQMHELQRHVSFSKRGYLPRQVFALRS